MGLSDVEAAVDVAVALPAWFNDDGIRQIREQVPHQSGAIAEIGDEVVGFVTWTVDESGVGEIAWLGVAAHHHRKGIGQRLLEVAEDHLDLLRFWFTFFCVCWNELVVRIFA